MQSELITIKAKNGMHARPAAELVKLVKECTPTRVTLRTQFKSANTNSVLAILALGLKCNTMIEVEVDGGNEQDTRKNNSNVRTNIKE